MQIKVHRPTVTGKGVYSGADQDSQSKTVVSIHTVTRCDTYIFKRGKSGVPRVQKGIPGKGMAFSHSTSRFHTSTHSCPRRQIWVQVRGNCTQKKVVTTKTHTHKEKRSGKLESEH